MSTYLHNSAAAPTRQRVRAAAVKQSGVKPDASSIAQILDESIYGPRQKQRISDVSARALARRIAEDKFFARLMCENTTYGGDIE